MKNIQGAAGEFPAAPCRLCVGDVKTYREAVSKRPSLPAVTRQVEYPCRFRRKRRNGAARGSAPGKKRERLPASSRALWRFANSHASSIAVTCRGTRWGFSCRAGDGGCLPARELTGTSAWRTMSREKWSRARSNMFRTLSCPEGRLKLSGDGMLFHFQRPLIVATIAG